ncbi:hypothetical protein [Variovorax sp. KBW07]|uniref:hypothetical protein n=1 Tax=Variovorax sp. KBW07 TaxID=2153358 RepID=UPI00162662A4|nr:hypothetical protein [Variovorax sp. KBW07]
MSAQEITLNHCKWRKGTTSELVGIDLLDCIGTRDEVTDLRGEQVAFTGSSFEHTRNS